MTVIFFVSSNVFKDRAWPEGADPENGVNETTFGRYDIAYASHFGVGITNGPSQRTYYMGHTGVPGGKAHDATDRCAWHFGVGITNGLSQNLCYRGNTGARGTAHAKPHDHSESEQAADRRPHGSPYLGASIALLNCRDPNCRDPSYCRYHRYRPPCPHERRRLPDLISL